MDCLFNRGLRRKERDREYAETHTQEKLMDEKLDSNQKVTVDDVENLR